MICHACGANPAACERSHLYRGRPCCHNCMHAWAKRICNPRLPLWLRVVAFAEAHAQPSGRCPLRPHQLHHGLDVTLTKPAVSRAIAKAIEVGWLLPESSARCLVLDKGATPSPDQGATPAAGTTHRRGQLVRS